MNEHEREVIEFVFMLRSRGSKWIRVGKKIEETRISRIVVGSVLLLTIALKLTSMILNCLGK